MERKRRSQQEFIEESIKIHGIGTYSYEHTNFINMSTKVNIYCNVHKKEFSIIPTKHLNGQGCQLCSYKKYRSKSKIKDTKYFIGKAKEVHGNLYDYTNTIYKTARDKVIIKCNCCNNEFYQIASIHLRGSGCPKCSHNRGMDKQRHTTTSFIEAGKLIHGSDISYNKTVYGINNMDKIIVTCTKCNTDSLVIPSNFLMGAKPSCNCEKHYGFQDHKPGILYYLEINNGEAYKIGITNKSVEDRFHNYDLKKIKVIQTWTFLKGLDARSFETSILNKFKKYKYKGPDLLNSGNSELFSVDILSL